MKRRISLLVMLLVVVGGSLAAQQPPAAEGFVPMSELTNREVLPATPLVFYAYGFVWVALLGYLWAIWRRLGKVEADLEAVHRRLSVGS